MNTQRSNDCRGFTLLELLISISLLVVILVITLGAMRISSRSITAGERRIDDQERFRTVLYILDAQIASQVPLTYEEKDGTRYYFTGQNKALRFLTTYSVRNGQHGYVIADYRVDTDDSGRETLYVSEQTPGIEDSLETRLISAREISFEYFYKDPSEVDGNWLKILPEGTVIPEKVRVNITRGTGNLSMVFPVRARGEKASLGGVPLR